MKKVSIIVFLLMYLFVVGVIAKDIVGIVLANGVNLRVGSGTGYEIIGKARLGEIYPVLNLTSDGWFQIKLPSPIVGYVQKKYLKPLSEEATFPFTAEVNASRVNVRSQANSSSLWVTKLFYHDKVKVYGVVGDWYSIQYSSPRVGYIYGEFFDLVDNRKGYIKVDAVNVRSGPGTDYPVVTKLYYEAPVIYLAAKDDWFKIKIRGGPVGWIRGDLVEFPFLKANPLNSEKEKDEFQKKETVEEGELEIKE